MIASPRLPRKLRQKITLASVALVATLTACSMHPLLGDIARVSTFDIVASLRCEAWAGLQRAKHDAAQRGREADVRKIIEGTAIGFEFNFLMTETNKAGEGRLEFDRASFKGAEFGFSLDFDAEASKKRQNRRVFRVVDDLTELERAKCAERLAIARGPNPTYPVTGRIGLHEIVHSYIRLELLTDIAREKDKDGVVFSDELSFTTHIAAGALPTVQLSTVAGRLQLSRASINGTATRNDVHAVTIALSRDDAHEDVDPPTPLLRGDRSSNKGRAPLALASAPKHMINLAVKQKVSARNRVLLELQRRRVAAEDARLVSGVLGVPVAP